MTRNVKSSEVEKLLTATVNPIGDKPTTNKAEEELLSGMCKEGRERQPASHHQ